MKERRPKTRMLTTPLNHRETTHAPGAAALFETPRERTAALLGSLALRASDWRWRPLYERWQRGEAISVFQRKFLAIAAHYRGHPSDGDYERDHRFIASLKPFAEKSR